MSHWISLYAFSFELRRAWIGHDAVALVESAVRSRVPLRGIADPLGEYQRIEQFVTLDTTVDVIHDRVCIPTGTDPSRRGPFGIEMPGFKRWKCFTDVQIDEDKASKWLRENVEGVVKPPPSKPGPKSKFDAFKEYIRENPLAGNKEIAKKIGVKGPRTTSRYRARKRDET